MSMRSLVKKIIPGILLASSLTFAACAPAVYDEPVEGTVVVQTAPPPAQVEVRPAAPYAGGVWIEGFWSWNGGRYVWVPGRWEAPRRGWVWVPHHYTRYARGWRYVPGHWRRG